VSGDVSHRISHVPRESTPSTIAIREDQWVVEVATNQTLLKLPSMVGFQCLATSGRSLAIGTDCGQVIILNFPVALFHGLGSRLVEHT
jgi:hypothetical protein